MISGRVIGCEEIHAIWSIDRGETVEAAYRVEHGLLVLRPYPLEVPGWPPGQAELYTPILQACHDHGGWLHGLFDGPRLVSAAALENRPMGPRRDQLQFLFLHVDRAYRGQGLGRHQFALASAEAIRRGARSLYVTATPSQHTVDFYLDLGCELAAEVDADLFALEPEDIHLVYPLVPEDRGALG